MKYYWLTSCRSHIKMQNQSICLLLDIAPGVNAIKSLISLIDAISRLHVFFFTRMGVSNPRASSVLYLSQVLYISHSTFYTYFIRHLVPSRLWMFRESDIVSYRFHARYAVSFLQSELTNSAIWYVLYCCRHLRFFLFVIYKCLFTVARFFFEGGSQFTQVCWSLLEIDRRENSMHLGFISECLVSCYTDVSNFLFFLLD